MHRKYFLRGGVQTLTADAETYGDYVSCYSSVTTDIEQVSSVTTTSIVYDNPGVKVEDVTVDYGTTEVTLGVSLVGINDSMACTVMITYPEELELVSGFEEAFSSSSMDGYITGAFIALSGLSETFSSVVFSIPEDAAPGTVYEINVSVSELDNGGTNAENAVGYPGSITIGENPDVTTPAVTTAITTAETTVSASATTAASVSDDNSDYLYYDKIDGDADGTYDYIVITDCDESVVSVEIPSEIDGLPVTGIRGFAFADCSNLESITIPDSVNYIGNYAFDGTALLAKQTGVKYADKWVVDCDKDTTNAEIKEGTRGIADSAFMECSNLISVRIYDGLSFICVNAFAHCVNLESVILPDSLMVIGYQAFWNCSSLTSITIPDSVTLINSFAFWECTNLEGDIVIPENVQEMGEGVFLSCDKISSITIKNPECSFFNWIVDVVFNGTIYGYTNSDAQILAITYGNKFESIGEYTPEVLKGDANGNGKIAASDAAFIAKLIAQASILGETVSVDDYPAADFNGDGRITAQDAARIAKYVAELALKK